MTSAVYQMGKMRNNDLDIVRGALVLIMLMYHCASVTWGTSLLPQAIEITERVSFIHYAFVMVSGYLCGWYYAPRINAGEKGIRRRLAARGLKLLGLLFLLNATLYATGIGMDLSTLRGYIASVDDVINNFILGMKGSLVAFEILYYIAVLLLMASVVIGRVGLIPLSAAVGFLLIFGPMNQLSVFSLYGFLGIIFGILSHRGYFDREWNILRVTHGVPVMIALLLYQWFLSEVRGAVKGMGLQIIVYTCESICWFLSFVFILRFPLLQRSQKAVSLLGRYTLIGYIAQMVIIRGGYAVLVRIDARGLEYYLLNLVFSTLLLYLFILSLNVMRTKYNFINSSYRLVFE